MQSQRKMIKLKKKQEGNRKSKSNKKDQNKKDQNMKDKLNRKGKFRWSMRDR